MRFRHSTRLAALALAGLVLGSLPAAAHDIPDRISMHAFVKPEGNRLHLLVRVPLTLLLNLNLPKRGPGYLDLAHVDGPLAAAAEAAARDFEVRADGTRLDHVRVAGRISQSSDRAFESYDRALALIEGPKLPEDTDVFWNQGFFDVHLEYPIESDRAEFTLTVHTGQGLGNRLVVDVHFLPPDGGERIYVVQGGAGTLSLDPRWYQAAWFFVGSGIHHILGGIDHLLFLVCLVLPFRRLGWDLVGVVTAFTVAHSITLLAAAYGLVPSVAWFPPLVETLIAASIVYMAIENVLAPNLSRRWLVTGLFGLVHGFGFSFVLGEELQFAGSHLLLSLFAFNLGVEIGQLLVLVVLLPALVWIGRRPVAARYAPIVVSVLVGHTAWHWMMERAEVLTEVPWPEPDADLAVAAARVLAPILVAAGVVRWLAGRRAARRTAAVRAGGAP
ncbi:MAG TPA: HupE/UreJ family protein [Thermodesulfobacteriota bacterium]